LPGQGSGRGPRRLFPQYRRRPDDEAVTRAFIAALEPAGLAATLAAAERLESDREAVLKQWRLGVERASYEAQRAERRYRAVDPDNRLVARGLESEWEERLRELAAAKADLERHEWQQLRVISQQERDRLLALGPNLVAVWQAATTTPRDRKELLRTLIEEVIVKVERDKAAADLTLRWKGGALDEIDLALPRSRPATIRSGHHRAGAPARGSLPRQCDRRHPQSAGANHGIRSSLHCRPRRQPASPLGYPMLRADGRRARGRTTDD
jgi:hypothetical protein